MLAASLVALAACAPTPEAASTVAGLRHVDVLRLLESQEREEPLKIPTWTIDGDSRATFFQHAPSRVVAGPIPPGEGCLLRFAIGFKANAWLQSDGVEFTVSVRRQEQEETIFSEFVDPRELERKWLEREVEIADGGDSPFELVLATGTGPTNRADRAGWGAPHVMCEVPSIAINRSPRPNVVLVSIDTLRRDHLGIYGYGRDTSPTLDALASESLVFDNAFSTAPHTLPSHASILTGLYPHQHGAGHSFPESPLEEDATTLAEVLQEAGYRTVGFSAGGMASGRFGLSQGFDDWTERQRANLRSMLPAVFDALHRTEGEPFFLFLHTYDVHGPYQQPEEHRFFTSAPDTPAVSDEQWQTVLETPHHKYQRFERFDGLEDVVAAYDSGIRFVDSQLAVFLDHLRATETLENTLLIVTTDHGETLMDRGPYISHAYSLHDPEVHVPLIVRRPGGADTGRRGDLVQLVDLFPMILDEIGIEAGVDFAGQNPLALAGESTGRRDWAQGESSHMGTLFVRNHGWKVISPASTAWETKKRIFANAPERFEEGWQIFDLVSDPAESQNLFNKSAEYPADVKQLVRVIGGLEIPGQEVGDTPPVEGELAESLRALGYLQ